MTDVLLYLNVTLVVILTLHCESHSFPVRCPWNFLLKGLAQLNFIQVPKRNSCSLCTATSEALQHIRAAVRVTF